MNNWTNGSKNAASGLIGFDILCKVGGEMDLLPVLIQFTSSFADQLSDLTDSISVVQAALGHSDERTTRIYLNALKDERLDPEMEKLYGV